MWYVDPQLTCLSRRVAPEFSRNYPCRMCEENIGGTVEKLCDVVETVWRFAYHDDRVSAGGGCEAAVTAKTDERRCL